MASSAARHTRRVLQHLGSSSPFLQPGGLHFAGASQRSLPALVSALKGLFAQQTSKGAHSPSSNGGSDSATGVGSAPTASAGLHAAVQKLLGGYSAHAPRADWKRYAFFDERRTTKNLVDGTRTLSWCWLTSLEGEVEEARYKAVGHDAAASAELAEDIGGSQDDPSAPEHQQPCPKLTLQGVSRVLPGSVAYVNDSLHLHSVGCPSHVPAPGAVTLHLYAPPIKRDLLYMTEDNRVVTRTAGFHSIRGVKSDMTGPRWFPLGSV